MLLSSNASCSCYSTRDITCIYSICMYSRVELLASQFNGWRHNYVPLPVLAMWAHVCKYWYIFYAPPQIIIDKGTLLFGSKKSELVFILLYLWLRPFSSKNSLSIYLQSQKHVSDWILNSWSISILNFVHAELIGISELRPTQVKTPPKIQDFGFFLATEITARPPHRHKTMRPVWKF